MQWLALKSLTIVFHARLTHGIIPAYLYSILTLRAPPLGSTVMLVSRLKESHVNILKINADHLSREI